MNLLSVASTVGSFINSIGSMLKHLNRSDELPYQEDNIMDLLYNSGDFALMFSFPEDLGGEVFLSYVQAFSYSTLIERVPVTGLGLSEYLKVPTGRVYGTLQISRLYTAPVTGNLDSLEKIFFTAADSKNMYETQLFFSLLRKDKLFQPDQSCGAFSLSSLKDNLQNITTQVTNFVNNAKTIFKDKESIKALFSPQINPISKSLFNDKNAKLVFKVVPENYSFAANAGSIITMENAIFTISRVFVQ